MSEPLPYTIPNEEVQGNFDALAKLFPLARKNMKIETPHLVGGSGEPSFENSWVNFNAATHQGARFWKDPMDVVHVEGLVKSGTVGATIFTLPTGYRPARTLLYEIDTSTGAGRVDVNNAGQVVAVSGGNGHFSINISFKQEQ